MDRILRALKPVISVLAVLLSVFVMYTAIVGPLVAMRQRAVVLMFSLLLIFLIYPLRKKNKKISPLDLIWAGLGLAVTLYVIVDFENLVLRMGMPNKTDLIMGGLAILLVLEGTRRSIGWPLPIVASLFLAYAYYGNLIPGTFGHKGYSVMRIINQMYMTTEGIFGVPIGVIVSFVFLFVLFGSFLSRSGGGDFFIKLAISLAGTKKGGPAKIAIFASGFLGMISGSSIANVVTTGSFTIPLMKKVGYNKEFAGSVEAAASTGGQIMPPIMGAAAFVMTEFTQIPYMTIVLAAIIPALLYYFSLYMNVHFEACRSGLEGLAPEEVPKFREVLKEGWHYLFPLVSIIVVLIMGFSPTMAAYFGIFSLIVVSAFKSATRMGIKAIYDALEEGAKESLGIVAATASAGMITGIVSMTGLGLKFSTVVSNFADGNMLIGLIMTMFASIVLGMSLPTTANYIVQAAISAPALVALGVPLLTAHLFVLYFGVFADITPPVALAAYAAAGISEGDPMKTGVYASRNVLVAFLIPYLFVYFPALLGNAPALEVAQAVITSVLAVIALSGGLLGYLRSNATVLERIMLIAAGAGLLIPEWRSDLAGVLILVSVYAMQRFSTNRVQVSR